MKPRRAATPDSAEPSALSPTLTLAILAAIVLLAIGLRAYGIGSKEVWVDEANSVVIADRPVAAIIDRLEEDSSPPLFYILLHGWIRLFGLTEGALRSLSSVFGVGLVIAVWAVGREFFSRRVGLLAAFFVAIAPVAILYSQEIRMYTLLPLLALSAIAFTWRCVQRGGVANAIGMILFTLAALYTHNWALFLLPAQTLIVLMSGKFVERLKLWLVVAAVVVVAYLPWVPVFLRQFANKGQYAWLFPFWEQLGPLGMLRQTATTFAFSTGGFAHLSTSGTSLGVDLLIALVAWSFVGLSPWSREVGASRSGTVHALLAYLCVPIVVTILASIFATPCYVAGRCDQLVFPAFAILLAVGMGWTTSRIATGLVLVTFMSLSAATLVDYYGTDPKAGDKEYAMAVISSAGADEPVISTTLTRASLEYYVRRNHARLALLSYPRDTATHLGNQDNRKLIHEEHEYLVAEAEIVVEDAVRRAGRGGSFLVLASRRAVNHELREKLEDLCNKKELTPKTIGEYKQSLVRDPLILIRFTVNGPVGNADAPNPDKDGPH